MVLTMNDAAPAIIVLTAAVLAVLRIRVACAIRVRAWDDAGALEGVTAADALEALNTRGARVISFGLVRGETQAVEQITIQPFPGRKGSSRRFVVDLIPVEV